MLWWLTGSVAIVAASLVVLVLLLPAPDADEAMLKAKYGGSPSQFLTLANGTMAHYRDYPAATREPIATVVLLHGGNASLHTWEPWVQRLGPSMRVISVDLPGHGLTGATTDSDYTPAAMVAFVDVFTRTLGLDQRFVLVGNSMGGHVAWRFALSHPHRLSHLVLLDAGGLADSGRPQALALRLVRFPGGARILRALSSRAVLASSLKTVVYDPSLVTSEMIDRYWDLSRRPGTRDATVARFRAPTFDPAMIARLHEIKIPTLVLWGRDDSVFPLPLARAFTDAIPSAKLVVYDRCGHLPMEEAPDRSAADLRAFVEARTP